VHLFLQRKSAASLKQKKPKKQSSKTSSKTPTSDTLSSVRTKSPLVRLKEQKPTAEPKKEVEELDVDIFYSPSSHTLTSSKGSTHTLKNKHSESSIAPESEQIKEIDNDNSADKAPTDMAEDGDEYGEEFGDVAMDSPPPPQAALEPESETEPEYEEEEEVSLKSSKAYLKFQCCTGGRNERSGKDDQASVSGVS
jgi:hypothetical protein